MLQLSIPSESNVRWSQGCLTSCCFICWRQCPHAASGPCRVQWHYLSGKFWGVGVLSPSELYLNCSISPFFFSWWVEASRNLLVKRYGTAQVQTEQTDHPLPPQAFQLVSLPPYYLLPIEAPAHCSPVEGQTAIEHFPLKKKRSFHIYSVMNYSKSYCHQPGYINTEANLCIFSCFIAS